MNEKVIFCVFLPYFWKLLLVAEICKWTTLCLKNIHPLHWRMRSWLLPRNLVRAVNAVCMYEWIIQNRFVSCIIVIHNLLLQRKYVTSHKPPVLKNSSYLVPEWCFDELWQEHLHCTCFINAWIIKIHCSQFISMQSHFLCVSIHSSLALSYPVCHSHTISHSALLSYIAPILQSERSSLPDSFMYGL